MLKAIFLSAATMLAFSCNQGGEEPAAGGTTTSSVPSDLAGFKPAYSASFEMGDPANVTTVLKLWRDWESGDLNAAKSKFADSVTFYTADGSVVAGPLDSAMGSMQAYRNMFSKVTAEVHAVFPVKSTDMKQNWVCIWGKEYTTDQSGKLDSMNIQETWRFDSMGKVDLMYQFMVMPASMKK